MASRRRFAKANRFLRRRRRPTSFDGDFGLDDLFEEHAESKEEKQHANHKIGSTMCRYEPLFSDEEVAEAEAAARLKRVAEKKAREAERLSGWRRRRHGRRSGSNGAGRSMTPSSNRSADTIQRPSPACEPGSPLRTSPVSILTRSVSSISVFSLLDHFQANRQISPFDCLILRQCSARVVGET